MSTCAPQAPYSFNLSGFSNSVNLDGMYMQSAPPVNSYSYPMYVKEGDADWWCCHDASSNVWRIQAAKSKGSTIGIASTLLGHKPWTGLAWEEYIGSARCWEHVTPLVWGVHMTEVRAGQGQEGQEIA